MIYFLRLDLSRKDESWCFKNDKAKLLCFFLGKRKIRINRTADAIALKTRIKDIYQLQCDIALKRAVRNNNSDNNTLVDVVGNSVKTIRDDLKRSKLYVLPSNNVRVVFFISILIE